MAFRKNLSFFPQSFPNQNSNQKVKSKFSFLSQNQANVLLKHFGQLNGLGWGFCLQTQNITLCPCYSLWFWMELHSSLEQRTLSIRGTTGTTWHVRFPGLVLWWREGVGEFSLQLEEFRGCLQGVFRVSLLEGIMRTLKWDKNQVSLNLCWKWLKRLTLGVQLCFGSWKLMLMCFSENVSSFRTQQASLWCDGDK